MRVREKSDSGFDLGKTDEQVLTVQPVASSLASAAAAESDPEPRCGLNGCMNSHNAHSNYIQ